MYCRNCGSYQDENAAVCARCGAARGMGMNHCPDCGEAVAPENDSCPRCGYGLFAVPEPKGKSRIAAGLMGIVLGAFGIHNFYLGCTGKAMAQLMITVVSLGTLSWISAIWGLVEGIRCLSGKLAADGEGNPLR